MSLNIATNIQSLIAQRNLGLSSDQNLSSMERLSSGFRINKASDDAAGLAISEKLKADIRGLNMAKRNANDGISLVQTAEGGLNEVNNILVRLRELAIQGASDTIGNTERGFLNKEFTALKDEITRITLSTEHNGTNLLVGDLQSLDPVLRDRSGGYPIEIQVGKNFFKELDGKDKSSPVDIIRVDLSNINASVSEKGLNLGSEPNTGAHVQSKDGAHGSIDLLDKAITKVSGYRADLGAVQNRLFSAISNLSVASENASSANSRIRDTDVAEESAKLMQTNILKQAGVAVLAQANQSPSASLRLLS